MTQTNTDKTLSTERLREIIAWANPHGVDALEPVRAKEIEAIATELIASRTQEPAEFAKPLEAIIRDLVLWINTKSRHLPEKDRAGIQDYMRRMGIQGSILRAASITPPAPERSKEEVGQTERLNLHRKVLGMIRDKQRYAGAMLDGRELHVIAEALLDRAIETEKAALEPSPIQGEAERIGQWFALSGDARLGECATEGCGGQPTSRLEAGGYGSNYCSGCAAKISPVLPPVASPRPVTIPPEEGVRELSVADAVAQLNAAIETEKRHNAVRDEMLATVIVNLEKSEMTAEFAVLLRDYVRAERAKLSALSVKPGEEG